MNKIFLYAVCILLVNRLISQQITLYEYWFNNEYQQKQTISVGPVPIANIISAISTSQLTNGLHQFNFRAKASNGLWTGIISQYFYKNTYIPSLGSQIVAYQYWTDNNFSQAVTVNETPQNTIILNTSFTLSNLEPGPHLFNIRFKDNSGKWSPIIASLFLKLPQQPPLPATDIVTVQYWIDNNYTQAQIISTASSAVLNLSSQINVNQLMDGIHTISFRCKDNLGQWSSVITSLFYKVNTQTSIGQQIVGYEYWFNNQPVPVYMSVPLSSVYLLNISVPTHILQDGINTLYIRFKDNSGKWSNVVSSLFLKEVPNIVQTNALTGYRYWFDDSQTWYYSSIQPQQQGSFLLLTNIDMTYISKGQHVLHLQFVDSLGQWSSTIYDTITKLSYPVARFSYQTQFYCDSTIVTFINQSTDGDVFQWFVNNQLISTDEHASYTFTQPGIYQISLHIRDTITLQDSTVWQTIEIKGKTYSEAWVTSCDSLLSPSGQYVWTQSGTYNDTIVNYLGCDSIITYHVTINNSSHANIFPVVCDSYISPSGQYIWNLSGTYTDTIPNISGCDSILTINLSVIEVDTSIIVNQQSLIAQAQNATFQWCMCDSSGLVILPGETQAILSPLTSAYFAVIVTQQGCTDTSSCRFFNYNYYSMPWNLPVKVYPNPLFENKIFIELPDICNFMNVQLSDISGKNIIKKTYIQVKKISIDVDLNPGTYLLQIVTEHSSGIFKLLKK
ncbi:MAG: T9SS type A sorting domain-containing protein [Bacteroidales bacterium]|nr:T9SS type A sorting domain-containing protein [Bacteroidales bacterium]